VINTYIRIVLLSLHYVRFVHSVTQKLIAVSLAVSVALGRVAVEPVDVVGLVGIAVVEVPAE
jgi:hypothetical protein